MGSLIATCTVLVGDVNSRGGFGGQGREEENVLVFSLLSALFCCESRPVLENKVY